MVARPERAVVQGDAQMRHDLIFLAIHFKEGRLWIELAEGLHDARVLCAMALQLLFKFGLAPRMGEQALLLTAMQDFEL